MIKKRSADGTTSSVTSADLRDVRWLTVTPEGTVYLTDLYDLVRVTPDGKVQTIEKDLAGWSLSQVFGPDRHAVMGLWTDVQGNVYAAFAGDRQVNKVNSSGIVQTVARSNYSWSPTGGLVAADGDLWLLENSVTNSVRVCRIDTRGWKAVFD